MEFNKVNYPNIDEILYCGEHESGLKVYLLPKKFIKSYAVIGTRFGSANDKFVMDGKTISPPDGIAHFLEHKLFEKKDGTNAFDDYAKTGASANAYTGFSSTCYLFSCTDRLKDNLEILLSFVFEPYFTNENVEKEQGIITQEIRMYDDDPGWAVYFNLLKCLYSRFPIRKDIAGTAESIREITPDMLYTCYNAFYNPKNMVLFIAGDVTDFSSISKIIDKNIQALDTNVPAPLFPDEPEEVNKAYCEQKMSVPSPMFMLGFKETKNGATGTELFKRQIATEILLEMLFGKSSSLYQSLYDQGLINDSFSSEYACDTMYAHTILGGESPDPHRVCDEIFKFLDSAELSEEDFQRSKKALAGHFLHSLNSVENIGHEFISGIFTDVNILDYMQISSEINFNDVQGRFKDHLRKELSALSVVLPHQA